MKTVPAHGGNVYEAARASGRPIGRLTDFSASINPLGPSPAAVRALRHSLPQLVHYPDPDCLTLRRALAKRWRLASDQILVGNGSTELIHLLPRALGIRHALLIGPTFSEYARAVALAGGRISYLHARRSEGYRPPLERVLHAMQHSRKPVDAIFLCNPNSPTGRAVGAASVRALVRAAARRRIRVILDETFVEYCAERSVLRDVPRSANLLVLRSFTKFYAMPALRLGYLVGAVPLIQRVRALQPPWSVNTPAQVFALAALGDQGHANRSLASVQQERARFVMNLKALPGVTVYPSEANFLLLELPMALSARVCAEALARRGLLIRDCSSVPGLNRRTVRVAVRRRMENCRLVTALCKWIGAQA
ncbi:MAG: threonine-phosphate decarboxylase [Nitrospirae bacterium]|nr:MAG: threonine-phosphate decarboxylase [Nitrospirota bacterium]